MTKTKAISKVAFAKDRKVAKSTVSRWVSLGMPVTEGGGIDRKQAIAWIAANTGRQPVEPGSELPESFAAAHARKEAHLADLRGMEAAQLRGELVAIADFEHEMGQMISTARNKMLGIPSKLAPDLINEPSVTIIQAKLKAAIHEALTELASAARTEPAAEQKREDLGK